MVPGRGPQSQEPREQDDVKLPALSQDDESSRRRYKDALQRFLRVSAQRKRRFQVLKRHESESKEVQDGSDRKHESSDPPRRSRLFLLSVSEKPWNVFVPDAQSSSFLRRLRIKRLVFEWSDLHLSALHTACGSGDQALVRKLLTVRTPSSPSSTLCCSLARDASGRVPLHHAVIREQHKVVKVLLKLPDARLQAHVRDNSGYSAAHYALLKLAALAHCRYPKQPSERVAVIMKRMSKKYRRLWRMADRLVGLVHPTYLNSTTSNDNDDLDYNLKALDLRCRGDEWDATRNGDLERLQFLLKVHHHSHTSRSKDSAPPELPVLRELRRSLLHEACDWQQLRIVYHLLTQWPTVFPLLQDASGCTALHCAAMRGFLEGCVELLEEQGGGGGNDGDVEALCLSVDSRGRTALHWSLLSTGVPSQARASVAKYLVGKCASALHIQDLDGLTPLHLAVARGDLGVVQLFVQLGANVNASPFGSEHKVSKATASWTPCGARFRGKRKSASRAAIKSPTLENEEENDGELSNQSEAEVESNCEVTRGSEREHMEGMKESRPNNKCQGPNPQDDNDRESESCVARADENSVVMDTLWYWVPNRKQKRESTLVSEIVPDSTLSLSCEIPSAQRDVASADDDKGDDEDENSARGCRKYGGVCRECAVNRAEATIPQDQNSHIDAAFTYESALSPLMLAIRACKRRSNASEHKNRVGIVEFLLLAGADSNGSDDDKDSGRVENGHKRTTTAAASPLLEALYAAFECPQVLPLLLLHGAKRICASQLERLCLMVSRSTTSTGGSTAVACLDTVLLSLVDIIFAQVHELEDRHSSVSLLLSAFFEARCFNSLTKLLQVFMRHRHSSSRSGVDQDQVDSSPTSPALPLSLWEAIRTGLAERERKARSHDRQDLDREHLWFLCESLKRIRLLAPSRGVNRDYPEGELRQLLGFCVDRCLANWGGQARSALVNEAEHVERQRMVSSCLELLHQTQREQTGGLEDTGPDQKESGQFDAKWLDHCVALGLFDCALALIDIQLQTRQSISIDHLLNVYGDHALANRHHLAGYLRHNEFLLALVGKCTTGTDADHRSQGAAASMGSVVRACAYNLPLELVHEILRLALLNRDNGSRTADICTSFRVDGKTLCEWLVVRQRRDLIPFLLEHEALALERVALWRDCVSAAAVSSTEEVQPKRELLSWLLSLYPSRSGGDCGADEDEEFNLIKWLVLDRAVRCDSPLLFTSIIEPLWSKRLASRHANSTTTQGHREEDEKKSSPHQPNSDSSDTAAAVPRAMISKLCTSLLEMGILQELARWNAVRLANYMIQELFAKALPADQPQTKWHQALLGQQDPNRLNDPSALEVCFAMGHADLAQLFLCSVAASGSTELNFEPSSASQDLQLSFSHGLFRTIMRLNSIQVQQEPQDPIQAHQATIYRKAMMMLTKQDEQLGNHFQSDNSWQTACRFNFVAHLEALKMHQRTPAPVHFSSDSGLLPQGLPVLLRISIESGSLDALRWLLSYYHNTTSNTSCSTIKEPEVQALYHAASRHSSDLYAHMTLLLLEHLPYKGRLAGHGAEATLLHRCVCFSSPQLMQQAVNRVLSVPGSSVNVLDACGNSPVVYAATSGNLAALCVLVQSHKARLEAEFEGQTSFYYSLQLLPSFSWRWVLKKVLVEKCQRRFLHCEGDAEQESASCGCKGFEAAVAIPGGVETGGEVEVCGFCGHGAERHSKVPFPPWFMDQYETYLGVVSPAATDSFSSSSSSRGSDEENSDSEGYDEDVARDSESGRRCQGESDECDESTLEDQCGRLNAADLRVITAQRYSGVINENGLSSDPDLDEGQSAKTTERSEPSESLVSSHVNDLSAANIPSSLPFENLDPVEGWEMVPLRCLLDQCDEKEQPQQQKNNAVVERNPSENRVQAPNALHDQEQKQLTPAGNDVSELDCLPWHLRNELHVIHPRSCHCHDHGFFITESMWKYEIVSRWLWVSASRYCSSPAQQQPAAWRTTLPLRMMRSPKWTLQLAFARWRKGTPSPQSLVSNRLSLLDPRRRRKLQQFLSHWRFANAFVAFQHWKHSAESKTVRHMQLESLFEDMVTQMRISRLEALKERHKQLHKTISVAVGGDWECLGTILGA